MKRNNGFSLVEIAIVLVIIGLIGTLIAPLFMKTVTREKLSSGKYGLEAVRKEVLGYVLLQNGSLPSGTYFAGRTDPWGKEFVYHSGVSQIECGVTGSTTMTVTLMDGGTTVYTATDVAFFVSSNGPNHLKQVNDSDSDNIVIYSPSDQIGGDAYDDIAEFVTLYQLTGKLCTN